MTPDNAFPPPPFEGRISGACGHCFYRNRRATSGILALQGLRMLEWPVALHFARNPTQDALHPFGFPLLNATRALGELHP